ncbi:methyl-accepting chemotaxis protein [Allopseudospirillum japonicum]|uniref:Methyl-accepting chemotaxis protein n=1 Tax=Allopseudospirillum japonicum TaxID=64971 RepID=A0A1H6QTA4_9GAMM|nr:methyl-accepting chemotaxis protein [Allopseudospirillum japonicum]SEI42202.1 methyl-accepting chemotaxis protein [Allopseudospirillum japonicum]
MSFKHLAIRWKLSLIVWVFVLGVVLTQGVSLRNLHEELLNARKEKVQEMVEGAYTLAEYYYQQRDQLGEEGARLAAMEAIRAIRYGKSGYLWINDQKHRLIMHPMKPQSEGKDMTQVKDASGKFHWQEMVQVVQQKGAGFVDYTYIGPQFDQPQDKVSYVQGFQPWGWVLGSGVFLQDVNDIFYANLIQNLLALSVVVVLVMLIVQAIARHISQPLESMVLQMEEIAQGDLTHTLHLGRRDELGRLADAADQMMTSLRQILSKVEQTSDHLYQQTESLSSTVEQTRSGMQHQFEQVDTLASAMQEMSATIQEVAQSAASTATSTEEANTDMQHGQEVMRTTITTIAQLATQNQDSGQAMQDLHQQTQRIGQVIEVIQTISEQTNLLALNAAIEAARAGENGRGFAVVADEVRSLAQRTQEATLEIQTMIEALQTSAHQVADKMALSYQNSQQSVQHVQAVGEDLQKVVQQVMRINQMSGHIASAAHQQGSVAEDISQSLTSIRQVSEETLQSTQAVSSASHQLHQVALNLQSSLHTFRF